VPEWLGERLTGFRIPNSRCVVIESGDHVLPIRTELGELELPGMSEQVRQELAGPSVPNPGCIILGNCNHALPIRTKLGEAQWSRMS